MSLSILYATASACNTWSTTAALPWTGIPAPSLTITASTLAAALTLTSTVEDVGTTLCSTWLSSL